MDKSPSKIHADNMTRVAHRATTAYHSSFGGGHPDAEQAVHTSKMAATHAMNGNSAHAAESHLSAAESLKVSRLSHKPGTPAHNAATLAINSHHVAGGAHLTHHNGSGGTKAMAQRLADRLTVRA